MLLRLRCCMLFVNLCGIWCLLLGWRSLQDQTQQVRCQQAVTSKQSILPIHIATDLCRTA
jgi:hypothetical protein